MNQGRFIIALFITWVHLWCQAAGFIRSNNLLLKQGLQRDLHNEKLSQVSALPPHNEHPHIPIPSLTKRTNSGSVLPSVVWKGLMLLICVIWATNFAVIKKIFDVLPDGVLDPSLYVATRFTIAALVMLPGLRGSLRNRKLWMNGLLVGLCVFTGYIGQSMGILTSTASKTAFFCSMNVVWVALVTGMMNSKFRPRTWISVLLAISGAAFIELKGLETPTLNDLWLLLQPIGFGSGYIVLEQNMREFPDSAQAITSMKLLTVAVCTLIWAGWSGHSLSDLKPIFSNRVATAGILYTSLVTTAFAIWLQSVVFKRVSSTDASIILTSEPLWAALFAVGMIGEVLSRHDLTGGALIILGCLVNEIDVVGKLKAFLGKRNRKQDMEQGEAPIVDAEVPEK